jgi:hypothetical protein
MMLLIAACKKEDSGNPGGGAGNGCASDANICFKLGDSTRSFKGAWYGILGGGRSFAYKDSLHDFSMDVGSGDARSFTLAIGSLWSGGARMSYYDKRSGKSYNAYRGTVNITSVDNGVISGTFEGAVRNYSNAQDTLVIQSGTLTAVPLQ